VRDACRTLDEYILPDRLLFAADLNDTRAFKNVKEYINGRDLFF